MTEDLKEYDKTSWGEVKISSILTIDTLPVDLYIQININKFVKIYSKEDSFLKDILQKYNQKNIKLFYCRKEDYEKYNLFLLGSDEKTKAVDRLEIIQGAVNELGISNLVVTQLDNISKSNLKSIDKKSNLSLLLAKMLKSGDYLAQHSQLVSFFACLIAKETDWGSGQILEKLSMAGLVHDLTLSSDILIRKKLNPLDSLDRGEVKKYNNHIDDILAILQSNSSISGDVIDMVSDHHQFSIDDSFPSSKSASVISQRNAVFILADYLCHSIHDENGINFENFKSNWPSIKEHFNKGNFKPAVTALEKVLKLGS